MDGIKAFCDNLADFLTEKNKRYGNSALEPLKVFSKTDELRRNDVIDLVGYLVLLSIAKGWTDFNDLID